MKVVSLLRIDEREIEGVNGFISLTKVVNKFHCFPVLNKATVEGAIFSR